MSPHSMPATGMSLRSAPSSPSTAPVGPATRRAIMRELRIDTPHGQMAALRAGREGAPRLLAVHGWLDNAASFIPMLEHLGDFDVVAIDLPGHGYSFHRPPRSEEHTSELQSLMRISYAVFCLTKKKATYIN